MASTSGVAVPTTSAKRVRAGAGGAVAAVAMTERRGGVDRLAVEPDVPKERSPLTLKHASVHERLAHTAHAARNGCGHSLMHVR